MKRHFVIALRITHYALAQSAFGVDLASPDAKVRFEFRTNQQSRSTFQVVFNGKAVIERSPLGLLLDGADLSQGNAIAKTERYELKEHYPWRGVHSWATNHCHGARLELSCRRRGNESLNPAGHTQLHQRLVTSSPTWTLEIRAFNDGVAFRHIIPGADKPRIPDEATKFRLPAHSTLWTHDLGGHYEDAHDKRALTDLKADEWVAPPLTFKLPGNSGYASITEAALANYSGMALQADGQGGLSVGLGHKHPISYPYRLRYSNDIERVSKAAQISGAITSAWRVVMIAADLNGLVNSDILHNLCPPADPKPFPKGVHTEWVKPGRAVWKYLDGGRNTFEEMKDFSRLAAELGFEYHVIEGFWSRWTDEQVKELADYSRERGVGLFLWRHSRQLRTPEARDEFFKKLQRAGVAGAKIDFFDHEHREIVDLYTTLLSAAAKHRVMVNFHGANKPTGESRTWPNELIREGVRGMESSRLQARAKHNTTLPFTRYLAGHGDYTPVHFGSRRGDTTWAHQIATAAVFNEPLLTYGAHPTNLLANPALPMIKSIPAVWDETIVLPMSEIGELAAFARRSGDKWFLAILNGPAARAIKVPLPFLRGGGHEVSVVRDDPTEPAGVKLENLSVRADDSLTFELAAGGGFIGRFQAAKQRPSLQKAAKGSWLPSVKKHPVASAADILRLTPELRAGDVLVMADGDWKGEAIVFKGNGTEQNPITLRAETPGKVLLTGGSTLTIDGQHLVVSGLSFGQGQSDRSAIELRGRLCRLTETAVIGGNYKFFVHVRGAENRVDHCYLAGKTSVHPTLQVEVEGQPNHHRIDHNFFGPRPPLRRNGGETIRVGYSHQSMTNSATIVEKNLFERCDGENEIISNKSCENIYRFNTFRECGGMFTLRHGNRCRVEGNFFLGNGKRGSGGIRVIGEDHVVINNYVEGVEEGGFWITSGIPDSPLNGYFRARNCLIAFNTFVDAPGPAIELDAGLGRSRRTLRPENITIANNLFSVKDSLLLKGQQGANFKWIGNVWSSGFSRQTAPTNAPTPNPDPTPNLNPTPNPFSIIQPKLARAQDGLWRPAADCPARQAAEGAFAAITHDIDGHPRTGRFDVGCDQASELPPLNRPLTPADAGPSWMKGSPGGAYSR